jgi:NADH-quinone oxidoreductase subunit F
MPRLNSAAELEELRKRILAVRDPNKPCIAVCSGMGCVGNDRIIEAFQDQARDIDIRATGCHGYCEKGPMVVVHPGEICYLEVTPKDVPEIVSQTKIGTPLSEPMAAIRPFPRL